MRALWTWAGHCHHGRKQYLLWPGPVLLGAPQECRRHSEVTVNEKPLTKYSRNHGENYTSTSHPASSVLKVLLAERNPPLCLPLGFPPQQTDGIIEATCNPHRTPGPKSHTCHAGSKSISAILVSDWTFKSSLRATYNKDRKAVKSKSKSTLQFDHYKTSCLSSCLERSFTFRHSALSVSHTHLVCWTIRSARSGSCGRASSNSPSVGKKERHLP